MSKTFTAVGPSDPELVARVQAGDRAAADTLLTRHHKLIWGCVWKLSLPDWVDTDDLFQAGQVAMWHAMTKWRPDAGAKFTTYAKPAVWHAVVRAAQTEQKKATSLDNRPVDPDGSDLLNTLCAPEPAEPPDGIREWVESLPPTHRQIVELRYGLSGEPQNWKQIGEVVGLSQSDARRMCGNCLDGM